MNRRLFGRRIAVLFSMLALVLPLPSLAAGAKAYVGEFKDNAVTVLDIDTNKVLKTIAVPAGPHGLVTSTDGKRVYVSSDGATTVSVIDTARDEVVQSIEVGKAPHGLALSADGKRLLVAVYGENQVAAIDTTTNSVVGQVPVPSPHNIAIRPGSGIAYVAAQAPGKAGLALVNASRLSLIRTLPLDKAPRALNFSPDGKTLYFTQAGVDAVQVLDAQRNQVTAQIAVGASPHHVIFAPRGDLALVAVQGPGTLVGIDPVRNAVIYTIQVEKQPHWIALGKDGQSAFVTNEGSNTVSIVDLNKRAVSATVPVGNGPRKIDLQVTVPSAPGSKAPNATLRRVALEMKSISIKGFSFMPAHMEIAAGQAVNWSNDDAATHSLVDAREGWKSGDMTPGATYRHVFAEPGTYEYFCSIHSYMQGRVIVH